MEQKRTEVTEKVKEFLKENIEFPSMFLFENFREAVINDSAEHKDAPELVLVFKYLSLEEGAAVARLLDMTEVVFFGGPDGKTKFHHVIEMSGYVDAKTADQFR